MAGANKTKPVRPRAEDLIEAEDSGEEELPGLEDADGYSSPSLLDTGEGGDVLSSGDEDKDEDQSDEDEDREETGPSVQDQFKAVSFGKLAQAQEAISRKRKRAPETNADQERKLEALRARLAEIKESKGKVSKKSSAKSNTNTTTDKPSSKKAKRSTLPDDDDANSPSGSDSDAAPRARSSKHAPTAQSTKYQVTRKRDVVPVHKSTARDPRFDPSTQSTDASKTDKTYSFLKEYEDDEMAELRAAIKKKGGSEEDKEKLRRKLMSMENKRKSAAAKERERDVRREHNRQERQAVKDGKKPFYLKKADVKTRAEDKRVEGMKKGERERAEVRKRKRESQREMKSMPAPRRIA